MAWIISQTLMKAYENSPCSREQAAESLVGTCLAGAQLQQSNTSPMPQAYLSPDKMTAFSRLSRFGMTFAPLTADRGADLLTWYLAGFRAKTSAQQEKAQESTENDQGFGEKWRGWLAKYDPDTSTWKTAQCSLIEDSGESLETWPRTGMTVGGQLWALPMSERRMNVTASGFWPTPQASDNRNRGTRKTPAIARRIKAGKQVMLSMTLDGPMSPQFPEWLMGLPLGWTDLKPLAMDKFQQWRRQHGLN